MSHGLRKVHFLLCYNLPLAGVSPLEDPFPNMCFDILNQLTKKCFNSDLQKKEKCTTLYEDNGNISQNLRG